MKSLLIAVLTVVAVTASAAYTELEWIESDGKQWLDTQKYPSATDRIEMKVRYSTVAGTQCLFCSREATDKRTMTCFLVGGALRFDRNSDTANTSDFKPEANTDYVIVADYGQRTVTVNGDPVEQSMAEGDFSPGSKLTLFASHTEGGYLSPTTSMENWASYRLYYLKTYDKDGNLLAEYVPARNDKIIDEKDKSRYGLYEKKSNLFCPGYGNAPFATGADVGTLANDDYVVTIEGGQSRSLTAEEIDALGSRTLVKAGEGMLIAGNEMANFAGDILITNGIYKAVHSNAFGTATGKTYVNGGTIWSTVGAPTTYTDQGGFPAYCGECFHLKGEGFRRYGAVSNTVDCNNFAGRGGIVLDGDTFVAGTHTFDFRYGSFDMNRYTLTTAVGSYAFRLVAIGVKNPGDIVVEGGEFEIQSGNGDTGSAAQTFRVKAGKGLQFFTSSSIQYRKLILEPGVRIKLTDGSAELGNPATTKTNWGGPVDVQDIIPVTLKKGVPLTFSGYVGGAGGFSATGGGWLQFCCATNAFAGGVSLTGVAGPGDLSVTGGVAVTANGAIPTNTTAGLSLKDAELRLYSAKSVDLPDLVVDGKTVLTAGTVNATYKSLTKKGTGSLTAFGSARILGTTEIEGGTFRFGSRVPDVVPGLHWYFQKGIEGGRRQLSAVPDGVPYQGIDPTGVGYGYKAWHSTSGGNNASTTKIEYFYTGYVRIPGEPGADVTCTFVSSIARTTKLIIGGITVIDACDQQNYLDGYKVSNYNRFFLNKPVTIKAGWQQFFLYMGSYWDTSRGPVENKSLGWVSNFGIGIDWQARQETNSVNFVKLLDPGDGSFLRATMDTKDKFDPTPYRPTFQGAVGFGQDAVLDVNDTAPYTPVTIPELKGMPTIRNGEVKVTGTTWTLRAGDLVAGATPLTVGANAKVTFPANVTIAGDASVFDYKKSIKARSLIAVEQGGTLSATTFALSDELKAAGFMLTIEDGLPVVGRERGSALIIK